MDPKNKNVPNDGDKPNEGVDDGGGASGENEPFKAFGSKEEHDDYVNSIVSSRLERDRESRGETREAITAEVRQELEAELRQQKAEEEGDYETLVTELADKVTERDEKIKKLEQKAKENYGKYEQVLMRSAVESALIAEGADPRRINAAFRHVDLTKVEVKDNGEVKGAAKAAEAAKEEIPELFTGTVTAIGGVPPSPKAKQRTGSKFSYNPNYSRPA